MCPEMILAVDVDSDTIKREFRAARDGDAHIVSVSTLDDALDWLWERGDDVTAIVYRDGGLSVNTRSALSIIERDWPGVRVESVGPTGLGHRRSEAS